MYIFSVSYKTVIKLTKRLYYIVTGSCRPVKKSAQMHYMYELGTESELFVAIVFHISFWE